MSTIEKLIIRGIRSYNPPATSTIDFQTPLTIIVGPNGSGKTTIIESLKYITTNDLPLNSKGGAFVYDPKIMGQSEVKSQVKLRFRNVSNNVMVITRSLMVVQKKTGVMQKTLESTLLFKNTPAFESTNEAKEGDNDGKKDSKSGKGAARNKKTLSKDIKTTDVSVSNRCANIDSEVQHHLGVSSAILQNVIFCHQEESNWILSEPGNVKKKLDDIFSTSKYSKALDTIRSVKKDSNTSFKMKTQELEFLADKKIKREKIESKIFEDTQRVEIIKSQLETLENECEELDFESVKRDILREEENENVYRRIGMEIRNLKNQQFDMKRRMEMHEIREEMERIRRLVSPGCRQENLDTSMYDFDSTFNVTDQNTNEEFVKSVLNYDFSEYFAGMETEIGILKNDENKLVRKYNILNSKKENITDFKKKIDEINVDILRYENRECELVKSINVYFERELMVAEILSDEHFNNLILEKRNVFTEKNKHVIEECKENTLVFENSKKEIDLLKDEKNKALYKKKLDRDSLYNLKEKIRKNRILLNERDAIEENSSEFDENIEIDLLNKRDKIEESLTRKQEDLSMFLQQREEDILINEKLKRRELLQNKVKNAESELLVKLTNIVEQNRNLEDSLKNTLSDILNEYKAYLSNNNSIVDSTTNSNKTKQEIVQEDLFSSSESFLNFSDDEDYKTSIPKTENEIFFSYDLFVSKIEAVKNNIKLLLGKYSEKAMELNILLYSIKKIFKEMGNDCFDYPITNYLFEEQIEDEQLIRDKIKELENKVSISTNAHFIYKNFQKKGLKYNASHLCKKPFTGNDKEDYNCKIENILVKMPERREEAEKELIELNSKISTLEISNKQKKKTNAVKNEMYNIFRRMKNILSDNKLLGHLCEVIDGRNNDVLFKTLEKITANKLIKYIEKSSELEEPLKLFLSSVNNIISESKYINEKITEVKSINVIKKDSNIDLNNIKREINQLKEKSMEIKKLLIKINRKKENMKIRQSSYSLIQEIKNFDIEIQRLVVIEKENDDKIAELCNKIELLEIKNKEIYDKLKYSSEKLNSSKIKFNLKNEDIKKTRNQLKVSVTEKETKLNFENKLTKNKAARKSIEDNVSFLGQHASSFVFENVASQNENNSTTLSVLKNSVEIFFKDLNRIQEELMRIKFLYNEKCGVLNAEKENVRLITENIKKLECEIKIRKLEKEYKIYDIKKLNDLKDKLAQLQERKNNLVSEKYLLVGEYNQLEKIIKGVNHELETDYKDITNKYSECCIETKALELILEDIEKCIKALDKSIVEYHSGKIEEVNYILKDLWINTYKGNDIEYIQLKSETNDNKIYNYRVVMVKNNVELDLRGRCSAGQKVLASILMRLALGDAFSSNFSVMALDEPTTNLDKENIEALAVTLSKIINKRRANKNFQLIVITHDEEFVDMMNREGVDYIYRVSRDRNGDSKIEKQEVF